MRSGDNKRVYVPFLIALNLLPILLTLPFFLRVLPDDDDLVTVEVDHNAVDSNDAAGDSERDKNDDSLAEGVPLPVVLIFL